MFNLESDRQFFLAVPAQNTSSCLLSEHIYQNMAMPDMLNIIFVKKIMHPLNHFGSSIFLLTLIKARKLVGLVCRKNRKISPLVYF